MVAGGVGLAPFATLAERWLRRGVADDAVLRRAHGARELFCLDRFEPLGVRLVLATEDGSRGRARPRDGAARTRASRPRPARAGHGLRLRARRPMLRGGRPDWPPRHGRPCEVSVERLMGCGLGGCYSCVVRVRTPDGGTRFVRSCLEGPVFDGDDIVWD